VAQQPRHRQATDFPYSKSLKSLIARQFRLKLPLSLKRLDGSFDVGSPHRAVLAATKKPSNIQAARIGIEVGFISQGID